MEARQDLVEPDVVVDESRDRKDVAQFPADDHPA